MGVKKFKLIPIDYLEMRRKLRELIMNEDRPKTKVILQILYIQLINGAKIREAYEGYYKWLEDPAQKTVMVKATKREKPVYRKLRIPVDEIEPINERVHIESVKNYAMKKLGVNTHSLRYAFIWFLAKDLHFTPKEIARIIKHAYPPTIAKTLEQLERAYQRTNSR